MSIVMTGGGTGGHLAIIKAVKEELKDSKLIYIGSTKGQDKNWFGEDKDFDSTYFLDTQGVVNQSFLGKFKSLYMLIKATLKSRKILKEVNAKVVFCVGGFSSASTSIASKLLKIPLIIHEQNAHIGSLNRLLRPYSDIFISSYQDDSPIKAYPIKKEFFQKARIREEIKTVIFLGGSQGAVAINKLALRIAKRLDDRGIKIIHQAGDKNIVEVKQLYRDINVEATVFGFTTKLSDYMAKADFAIARAGASTLWELSAIGCPTLFIPYPYAAGDHQYYNAKFLTEQGVAWIMREDGINPNKIFKILDENMHDRSVKLQKSIQRDGALQIANLLKKYE
ncbi:MAG: undecaprenyldiphospho-muramoylpentapeptide beta-N-acetylglucosaminyltransferase [Sulfurovaceae bacterium]|nr:undecaprenyldiphospho-muramoylpentapeptide beta-N-acetylglucosaminyltransferase [Sulfurovaceae bacterium]